MFTIQPMFGQSLITCFARLSGRPVAIVANQPQHMAGSITVEAADKATQFIQSLTRSPPLIFLTDNQVCWRVHHLKKLAFSDTLEECSCQHHATVPKYITLRKAYVWSTAMGMNPFDGQTLNLAFQVSFGAMPAKGADGATGADQETRKALREAELSSGYRSASSLSIDDIIDPSDTRNMLQGLEIASSRIDGAVNPKQRTVNL